MPSTEKTELIRQLDEYKNKGYEMKEYNINSSKRVLMDELERVHGIEYAPILEDNIRMLHKIIHCASALVATLYIKSKL